MEKNRVEAFSDGVMAIAITLLVLDIGTFPDERTSHDLLHQLGDQWPTYAAYVVSFLTIGVIWINHHATLRRVRSVDHGFLVLNTVLLLFVSLLPWTTKLLGDHLRDGGAHVAAVVYGAVFFLFSVLFYAVQRHILYAEGCELAEHITADARRRVDRRNRMGLAPYLVATALGFASAYATLAVCGAIAVYYALPGTIYGERDDGGTGGGRRRRAAAPRP